MGSLGIARGSLGDPQNSPEVFLGNLGGSWGPWGFLGCPWWILGGPEGLPGGSLTRLVMYTKEIWMFLRRPWGPVKMLKFGSGPAGGAEPSLSCGGVASPKLLAEAKSDENEQTKAESWDLTRPGHKCMAKFQDGMYCFKFLFSFWNRIKI